MEDDTSGELRSILISLVRGSRDVHGVTNEAISHQVPGKGANTIIAGGRGSSAGGKTKGQDGADHLRATRYHIQPKAARRSLQKKNQEKKCQVAKAYDSISKVSLEKAIDKDFGGDVQRAYLALLHSSVNRSRFFAQQLKKAIKVVPSCPLFNLPRAQAPTRRRSFEPSSLAPRWTWNL